MLNSKFNFEVELNLNSTKVNSRIWPWVDQNIRIWSNLTAIVIKRAFFVLKTTFFGPKITSCCVQILKITCMHLTKSWHHQKWYPKQSSCKYNCHCSYLALRLHDIYLLIWTCLCVQLKRLSNAGNTKRTGNCRLQMSTC